MQSGFGGAAYETIRNFVLGAAVIFENYGFESLDRILEKFINPMSTLSQRSSDRKKIAFLSSLVMLIGGLQIALSFNPPAYAALSIANNVVMAALCKYTLREANYSLAKIKQAYYVNGQNDFVLKEIAEEDDIVASTDSQEEDLFINDNENPYRDTAINIENNNADNRPRYPNGKVMSMRNYRKMIGQEESKNTELHHSSSRISASYRGSKDDLSGNAKLNVAYLAYRDSYPFEKGSQIEVV